MICRHDYELDHFSTLEAIITTMQRDLNIRHFTYLLQHRVFASSVEVYALGFFPERANRNGHDNEYAGQHQKDSLESLL